MNEPQSIAAEKITLALLAGNKGNCPLVSTAELIPISVGDSAKWPPTMSVTILDSFTVPKGQALVWTYLSLYTTLTDETSPAVNYGFNYDALAQIQYRSGASAASNFLDVTGRVESQAIFNKPVFFVFDPDTRPQIVLYPNGSTQATNRLRALAESHGYLIPASLASVFRIHATRVN